MYEASRQAGFPDHSLLGEQSVGDSSDRQKESRLRLVWRRMEETADGMGMM